MEVTNAHPVWQISCLVRDQEKGLKLLARFPRVRLVVGTLDAIDLIEDEVSKADITFNFANSDHLAAAKAIVSGMARRISDKPAYLIHTSGAGILSHENFACGTFGFALPSDSKVYDDWDGLPELTSLPDKAIHRHVDKVVLAASASHPSKIRTAIVSPSCVYGTGRGPGKHKSAQVYLATEVMLRQNRAIMVGTGRNIWNQVHIEDLSALYLLLGECAAKGGPPATWNKHGYYLAENGEFVWRDVLQAIAREAHRQGYLSTDQIESMSAVDAKRLHPWLPYLVGTTSRGVSKRAKILLNWKPKKQNIFEEVPEIVKGEAMDIQLMPKTKKQVHL